MAVILRGIVGCRNWSLVVGVFAMQEHHQRSQLATSQLRKLEVTKPIPQPLVRSRQIVTKAMVVYLEEVSKMLILNSCKWTSFKCSETSC